MAIDLHKEHYDSDGNRTPLTVYPEKDAPEIYPQREIYPQTKIVSPYETEKLPTAPEEADTKAPAKAEGKRKKKLSFGGLAILTAIIFCVIMSIIIIAISEPEYDVSGDDGYQLMHFAQNDVQDIFIYAGNSDVSLRYEFSSSDYIRVSSLAEHFTAKNDCGTLMITCEGDEDKYPEGDAETVTVTFPRKFYGSVQINGYGCNADVQAGGDVTVIIDSGYISAAGLDCTSVDLQTDNGNIRIDNSAADTFNIYTAAGNVDFMDSTAEEKLSINTEMGKIDARRVRSLGSTALHAYSGERYTSEGISGEIYGENLLLEGDTDLVAGNDGIRLYDTDLRDATIFSGGDVLAYLSPPEETYRIDSISPDSTVNTKNPDGEYSIKINSQGSADILFDSYPPFGDE